MAYRVKVVREFSAAHFLESYRGKPEPIHGHNYRVEVILEGDLGDEGYVVDFLEINSFLKEILPEHRNLNEILGGKSTAEILAHWIYDRLKERFPQTVEVWVWETGRFAASYSER
ncbi:MAG: 6-carboxytetrahydropterin synthase [Thermotogae bacterium]|nr:6-carboxytetrahydropterin synthase [Thermotogota bacterium]